MGWWNIPEKENLVIGDDVLDVTTNFLKEIKNIYEEMWNRKPTLEEFEYMLNLSFKTSLDNEILNEFDEKEVKSVSIKTAKCPKKYKVKAGDIFSFKINDGRYCFGRVINDTSNGTFVEIFNYISDKPILDYTKMEEWLLEPLMIFTPDTLEDPKNKDWQIIGNTHDYEPSEKIKNIRFRYGDGFDGKYFVKDVYENRYEMLIKDSKHFRESRMFFDVEILRMIDEILVKNKK